MRSLRSVINLAVPAVAVTSILGILYWLFHRRKPPADEKLTDPPDKADIRTVTEGSVSVTGDGDACQQNVGSVSVGGDGDACQQSVGSVSVGGDGDSCQQNVVVVDDKSETEDTVVSSDGSKQEKADNGSGEDVNNVDCKNTDREPESNSTECSVTVVSTETNSDLNKTSTDENVGEVDPVITRVGEQLVEQTIKEAIAICVENQCGRIAIDKELNIPTEHAEDCIEKTDVLQVSAAHVDNVSHVPSVETSVAEPSSGSIEETENTAVTLQNQIDEQIVTSSTEPNLHSEHSISFVNADNSNKTAEVDSTSVIDSNIESQIILENAIITESVLPNLNCDRHSPDISLVPGSTSKSSVEEESETASTSWHSEDVENDIRTENKVQGQTDSILLTNSNDHDDCDSTSSPKSNEQTNCVTDVKVNKNPESVKRSGTKVFRQSCEMSRSGDGSSRHMDRHSGEQLIMSNGDISAHCDTGSEASTDSGRGSSVVGSTSSPPIVDEERVFEFNIPSDMCGLFIGTRGKTIKMLRDQSGARLRLKNNPYTPEFQICVVEGPQSVIDLALSIIRRKFPSIQYPGMDMAPHKQGQSQDQGRRSGKGTGNPVLMPEIMQLSLPEEVSVDVVVSSIVDAGRLFVQQPTHPTFPSLERLNTCMSACYIQEGGIPDIPRPIETGVICAAPMLNGWYRAQIMVNYDTMAECDIKYVDYGGYSRISDQCLKQIRSDFMTLPFQAIECYLANLTVLQNEPYFSAEAAAVLEELTQGQLLQAQVVGRAEDGIPYIHLYQISGNTSVTALMVNRELVNRGVCRWVEILS